MQRSTVFSVVLCLGLALAATMTLMRRAERGMQRLDFSTVNVARVDHIQITGESPVELLRDGTIWRLANGREADAEAVAALLRTVKQLRSTDKVEQDAAAQAAVELAGEHSTRVRLLKETQVLADFVIGQSDAMATWVRDKDRSFRVAHLSNSIFRHPAKLWLQRRLFPSGSDDVQRLEVSLSGQQPYTLQRHDKSWRLGDTTPLPAGFRFNEEAAARLVTNLTQARADDMLTDNPAGSLTHLDKPLATLTVFYQDAAAAQRGVASHTLHVGAARDDGLVYAAVAGRPDVYLLPSYVAQSLQVAATDLRDMKLMRHFELDDVRSFTLVDGKQTMTVQREGAEGWRWVGPQGSAQKTPMLLDRGKVLARLRQVLGVRGMALAQVSATQAGLTPRAGQLTVELSHGDKAVLQFGKPSNPAAGEPGGYYVRGTADANVYVLQKGIRNNLLAMGDSLKSSATAAGFSPLGDNDALKTLPPEVRQAVQAQMNP